MLDKVQETLCPDAYKVCSETSKTEYVVRVDRKNHRSSCSCPDSRKGRHCKHRLAVALHERTKH